MEGELSAAEDMSFLLDSHLFSAADVNSTNATTLSAILLNKPTTTEQIMIDPIIDGLQYSEKGLIASSKSYDAVTFAIVAAVYALSGLLGIVTNVIAMIVIRAGENSSKEVKVQLTNHIIADLVTSMFSPINCLYGVFRIPYPDSIAFCSIEAFLSDFTLIISPLWKTCIAIERFVVVFFPFRIKRYTRKIKKIVAVGVWSLAVSLNLRWLTGAHIEYMNGSDEVNETFSNATVVCYLEPLIPGYGAETNTALATLWQSLLFSLPSLTITIMYGLIGIKLCVRKRQIDKAGSAVSHRKSAKNQTQVNILESSL